MRFAKRILVSFWMVAIAAAGQADVFNMPNGQKSVQFVTVGDQGNVADSADHSGAGISTSPGTGVGAVGYTYRIDKYDVTLGQYAQFLNAVAKTDTYGLYNSRMAIAFPRFGIARTGSPGSYSYSVTGSNPQAANMPVYCVSWGDAARFCNWLQNGQPTGAEDNATTETGAYTLNGGTSSSALMAVTRNAGAKYFIPNENEWYKAAYYSPLLNSGSGGYYTYATQSNIAPDNSLVLATSESNDANYYRNYTLTDRINILTSVETFSRSPSYYGTFDQSGDIQQWIETASSAGNRGLRGGYWNDALLGSYWHRAENPDARNYDTSFRVAGSVAVPEPSSLTLVIGASCGIWLWRRRK